MEFHEGSGHQFLRNFSIFFGILNNPFSHSMASFEPIRKPFVTRAFDFF